VCMHVSINICKERKFTIIDKNKLFITKADMKRPIDSCGFGTVYKGKWEGIPVAIKRLHLSKMTAETVKEFKREATIMASVNHLNTLRLYGVCLDSGSYCLVTPLMKKGSLYQWLHNEKKLGWSLRYQLSRDIACGLSYLHSRNILHRDLKSVNVLLNDQQRAVLCDFGLSRIKQETNCMSTLLGAVGTVAWMAPELFDFGTKYTKHADIYSLGMVFWEIASRAMPFAGAYNQAVLMDWVKRGMHERIPKDTPEEFAKLISACWVKIPSKRCSAHNIVTALDGIIKFNETKSLSSSTSVLQSSSGTDPPIAPPMRVTSKFVCSTYDRMCLFLCLIINN